MDRKKIVVMGFMGSMPIGGVVWQHIHYIVGLQRLGHEVYYIEDSARYPYDAVANTVTADFSHAAATLQRLGERFGFAERWAFCARYLPDTPTAGLPLAAMRRLYRDADAILNICGAQEFNDDILVSQRIIYVESDPAVEQVRVDRGMTETLAYLQRHCRLFTFGENVGTGAFPVPLHGLDWLPTRQPVVTDFWRQVPAPPPERPFSTIANWSTAGRKDVEWRGETYLWSKSLEFMKFVDAPREAGEPVELAVSNMRDPATRALFLRNGWRLVAAEPISIDFDAYVDYIRRSKGELTVAKDQYVRLHTGWFSDRSACYLAAGRPVITQDTGFTRLYGGAGGLFAFSSMEELVDSVRRVNADYAFHCRAAAELAQECFEAEAVLRLLLDRAGI
jgi:hypothetical protein